MTVTSELGGLHRGLQRQLTGAIRASREGLKASWAALRRASKPARRVSEPVRGASELAA